MENLGTLNHDFGYCRHLSSFVLLSDLRDLPTDVQAIRDHKITITPLQYNLTCGRDLHSLQDWKFKGFTMN